MFIINQLRTLSSAAKSRMRNVLTPASAISRSTASSGITSTTAGLDRYEMSARHMPARCAHACQQQSFVVSPRRSWCTRTVHNLGSDRMKSAPTATNGSCKENWLNKKRANNMLEHISELPVRHIALVEAQCELACRHLINTYVDLPQSIDTAAF